MCMKNILWISTASRNCSECDPGEQHDELHLMHVVNPSSAATDAGADIDDSITDAEHLNRM